MQWIDCKKKISIYFVYKLLILMIGLTSVALSATIMSNILKTVYMKQKENETILGWWLWKLCIQTTENFILVKTLDKQYVLDGYHSYVESGQCIIVFEHHISLRDWIQQRQLVSGHKLIQKLISILWYFYNTYFIYFLVFFLFYIFLFS